MRTVLTAAIVFAVAACEAESPPSGVEATCVKACEVQAENVDARWRCSDRECRRGCSQVIDRLTENEGHHVLTCVKGAHTACDDRAWARCAARVGPHTDGGPPAPGPPRDPFEDDEGD